MKIEFLGSGGAMATPRPGCQCALCVQARRDGAPVSRSGPSLYIHGPELLIDTPEESAMQLNRAGIERVPHAVYSHWHPDHIAGRRVFEMNVDWHHWPPQNRVTEVYLPQQVAADFRERLGMWEALTYMEGLGILRLCLLEDGEHFTLNDVRILPFRLAADYVYAFLLEEGKKRVLIAPDELVGWRPPDWLRGVDVAVIPMGIHEYDPFTGERRIPAEHPVLQSEATFLQTVEMARALDAGQIYMTHIEEAEQIGPERLELLADKLRVEEGLPVTFAFDTLVVEI
jgi:phosphoribosyl 1,2-cyclic phosphate phosphodiesterase